MLQLFQDNFISREATSRQFFRVTTSTQQILYRSSFFFRASTSFSEQPLLSSNHFFQNNYFFRVELLSSSHSLRIGSSFRQVLFGTATFLGVEMFRIKISTEELLFRNQVLLHSINFFQRVAFWKKANFSEKQYSTLSTFSGELSFQSGYFFKKRYLLFQLPSQKSYFFTTHFFRRVTVSQLPFLSTATVPIYQLSELSTS